MKKYSFITIFIVALTNILGYTVARGLKYNATGTFFGINFNILTFLAISAFSIIVYCFFSELLNKIDSRLRISDKTYNIINIIILVLSIIYLLLIYKFEVPGLFYGIQMKDALIRESMNHFLFVLVVSMPMLGMYALTKLNPHVSKCIRIMVAAMISFFGSILAYIPNMWKNNMWGEYHVHAYTNGIVNVMYLKPFDDINFSIYGHYGLIYYPFVKLLGNNYTAIAITTALFTGITYLLYSYILEKMIKNNIVYVLSLLGIVGTSVTFYNYGNYIQILPHRCLFPAVAVAYIMNCETKGRIQLIRRMVIELLIGIMAFVFNPESGAVVIIIFVAYEVVKGKSSILAVINNLLRMLFIAVSSFMVSWFIINTYNHLVGGRNNSLFEIIYPIGSSEYDVSGMLRCPIQLPLTQYTLFSIVFTVAIALCISKWWLKKIECVKHDYILFSLGISGLSSFTYFMNRQAAMNLSISHIQFVAIIFILADCYADHKMVSDYKEICALNAEELARASVLIVPFLIAMFLGFESIMSSGSAIFNRSKSTWETVSLEEDYENLDNWIPNEVKAFGRTIPELYYQLGKDPMVYTVQVQNPDINTAAYEELDRILREEKEIVLSRQALDCRGIREMLIEHGYETENIYRVFEGNNFVLLHYRKMESFDERQN